MARESDSSCSAMPDDKEETTNSNYSAISSLRGLEMGIARSLAPANPLT